MNIVLLIILSTLIVLIISMYLLCSSKPSIAFRVIYSSDPNDSKGEFKADIYWSHKDGRSGGPIRVSSFCSWDHLRHTVVRGTCRHIEEQADAPQEERFTV